MFWWLMKYVFLGPLLRLMYRPRAVALENVPTEGPAILAANHQSFLDDLLLPLVVPKRKVVFLAKADYFDKWYLRWFFKGANVIPVRRENASASEAALRAGVEALRAGNLVGIFPEGHRSQTGALLPARPGVGFLARKSDAPVVPVAFEGSDRAGFGRFWRRDVTIRFGAPFRTAGLDVMDEAALTDAIMRRIAALLPPERRGAYRT